MSLPEPHQEEARSEEHPRGGLGKRGRLTAEAPRDLGHHSYTWSVYIGKPFRRHRTRAAHQQVKKRHSIVICR
jgi:hypothetical protein